MASLVRSPDGAIWEERGGKWYEVTGQRKVGVMAAEGMSPLEAAGVGIQSELRGWGRNVQSLLGINKEENARIDKETAERVAGSKLLGGGISAGLSGGEMLPSLATAPLGMGVGGLAARGIGVGRGALFQAAEQAGISGLTGALGSKSGDMGLDAMVGALLGAGGFGAGRLAGQVVGAIRSQGAATRAAMSMTPETRGAAGIRAIEAGDDAALGVPAGGVPGGGGGAVAGDAGQEGWRLGSGTRPGAEGLIEGGTLPGALPGAAGLSAEQARLLPRAHELGFKFTPGEETGSRMAQQVEAGLERSPWTSGRFEALRNSNRSNLNRLAVRAIGEEGDELSQGVLNGAHERIGRVFERASGNLKTIEAGSAPLLDASQALTNIVREAGEGGATTPEVAKAAAGLAGIWENAGQITGERLLSERTKLLSRAQDYAKPGAAKGLEAQGLHRVIGVIDEVIEKSLPEWQRRSVVEARAQWRVLRSLEQGFGIDPGGNVRAGALYQSLANQFPMEMRRGNFATNFGATVTGARAADLMDAVRVSQVFKSMIKDSGTATGMAMQGAPGNILESIGRGLLGHTLGRAYLGAPGQALVGGGTALANAPNAAPGAGAGAAGLLRGFNLMGGL